MRPVLLPAFVCLASVALLTLGASLAGCRGERTEAAEPAAPIEPASSNTVAKPSAEAATPAASPSPPPSPEEVRDRPVLLRLENATGKKWDAAYVHEGSFRAYPAVDAGARSEYLPLRSIYENASLGIRAGDVWIERRAIDHMGEERLMPARVTLRVSLVDGRLKTKLSREPPVPQPEEMTAAFAAAERRLKKSDGEAWLQANRSAFALCKGAAPYVDATFVIAPSGRVGGVNVVTEVGPEAKACVVAALSALRFPAYSGPMEPSRTYRVPLR